MIERVQASKMLSYVLASYTMRELDRKWLDLMMDAGMGQRLKNLSSTQKHAFEFMSYLLSGWLVHNEPNPSAFRAFINHILTDVPSGIAKRMMADNADPAQVNAILIGLDDHELASVMMSARGSPRKYSKVPLDTGSSTTSWMGNLADTLERQRANLKKREWREKK